MALLKKTLILGAHAYFVRNGADDSGTPVSSSHKPSSDSSVLYEHLGYVMDGAIMRKSDDLEIMAPRSSGYAYVKAETIPLDQRLAVKLTLGQVNQYTIEALMGLAGAITVNTAQQPLVQDNKITGWLKLDVGDHRDTQRLIHILYCEISVNELKLAQKEHKHTLDVEVLDNASNTVNLVSLS